MESTRHQRLAKALFEAVLIVFAVLVALAVDEYWEQREERQLAETAVERITSELLQNRAELLNARALNSGLEADLTTAVEEASAGEPLTISSVNYEVALVGADAWETAIATRAIHFMDFDLAAGISRAYRVQELFADRQLQVVDDVSSLGRGSSSLADGFRALRGSVSTTRALECELLTTYERVLVGLLQHRVDPPLDAAAPECIQP